jgi:hypothetical protein
MRSVRGVCFFVWALLACGVQADTIPTLTAISAGLTWNFGLDNTGYVAGPDFNLFSFFTYSPSDNYPCSLPVPAAGCVAPGPIVLLQYPGPLGDAEGDVTLSSTRSLVYFEGNARIQYSAPTIVYPDLPTAGSSNHVTIPVVLSGSEKACLKPPNPTSSDLCSDYFGTPGYPEYLANISINVPGILTLEAIALGPDRAIIDERFTSVPEPASVAFTCIAVLLLAGAGYMMRGRRTSFL